MKPIASLEDLKEYFTCDYENGILIRRVGIGKARAGDIAGSMDSRGYLNFVFRGRSYLVHRVIFAMFHNRWPEKDIDHKNNIHTDNRICNLRDCTHSENMRNMTRSKKPKSGYRGVEWGSKNTWKAYIRCGGRQICLGSFKTPLEGAITYDDAARKLHGEFATTNFPLVTP